MIDLKKRPLSWSAISSFQYSKEQWYRKYIQGITDPANSAMKFGKEWGERIASDPSYMPEIPRHSVFEYKLEVALGGIPLIGYIDSYEPHTHLLEYKSHGKNGWTQKRVDEHGQIDMYVLMLHLLHGVQPKDLEIKLVAVQTQENGDFSISLSGTPPVIFETKRTTKDILRFANIIKDTVSDMQSYSQFRLQSEKI